MPLQSLLGSYLDTIDVECASYDSDPDAALELANLPWNMVSRESLINFYIHSKYYLREKDEHCKALLASMSHLKEEIETNPVTVLKERFFECYIAHREFLFEMLGAEVYNTAFSIICDDVTRTFASKCESGENSDVEILNDMYRLLCCWNSDGYFSSMANLGFSCRSVLSKRVHDLILRRVRDGAISMGNYFWEWDFGSKSGMWSDSDKSALFYCVKECCVTTEEELYFVKNIIDSF